MERAESKVRNLSFAGPQEIMVRGFWNPLAAECGTERTPEQLGASRLKRYEQDELRRSVPGAVLICLVCPIMNRAASQLEVG
jgi:hypothetical protein